MRTYSGPRSAAGFAGTDSKQSTRSTRSTHSTRSTLTCSGLRSATGCKGADSTNRGRECVRGSSGINFDEHGDLREAAQARAATKMGKYYAGACGAPRLMGASGGLTLFDVRDTFRRSAIPPFRARRQPNALISWTLQGERLFGDRGASHRRRLRIMRAGWAGRCVPLTHHWYHNPLPHATPSEAT